MAKGICVYAEYDEELDSNFRELVAAARDIKKTTKEDIIAILIKNNPQKLVEEIEEVGVDKIVVVDTKRDCQLLDDVISDLAYEIIKKLEPSTVLVPASSEGRSIFSRVAVKLNCGMTADCTELKVGKRQDGDYYLKQNKPSYGASEMVTIITRKELFPQMVSIRPGVYEACELEKGLNEKITFDIELKDSRLEVVDIKEAELLLDSIMSAELVVACGKGVLESDSYELMEEFSKEIGAAIGGTRPLADAGKIPFDHQIGQTGFTIRPKTCISLGASGAIQHTEGIKGTKEFIAINLDENAPIFNIADYGLIGDLREILEEYLKLDK